MATLKSSWFLLVALLISSIVLASTAEARPLKESELVLSSAPRESNTNTKIGKDAKQGYSKFLGTLGMVCECCDGAGGQCKTKWLEPCPNLQCRPWKQLRS
ncbi:hypothetical protein POM88_024246 [Heracleum sosnowskyi]|uniref:Uncharacterized protein n=1 Tax=Heracleum sosnowskyi TaxID=360622 RepID=A0AAD8I3R2_9APIA|nr:hypothetical protein POM88_024246 [Heracleum sosnowskyi]